MMKRGVRRSFPGLAVGGMALGLMLAGQAGAVHVNPRGTGQVLLFPYYTVNKEQQTYITVINTTDRTKAVQVNFREGYNSRMVMDFRVFLSPYDVWTGTVFALEDATTEGGQGAAILTSDRSCTAPDLWTEGHGMLNGSPYARFSSFNFHNDGGPQGDARMREGHVEIFAQYDLTGSLADAVSRRVGGVPIDCSAVRNLDAPTSETVPPAGGLLGSAAVINVGQGTYFPYRADALDDFTSRILMTGDALIDLLGMVNDGDASTVTARVFADGELIEATYSASSDSERIDAVSAVLMADTLSNDYLVQSAIGANSDWVVTFPTKRFYTDPQMWLGETAAQPFVELFGEGGSCVRAVLTHFNREGTAAPNGGFGAPFAEPQLCFGTNVLAFLGTQGAESAALGSRLLVRGFSARFDAGLARLDLNPAAEPHSLYPSLGIGGAGTGGGRKVFHGLPAIGFWASNLVNNQVADGVMSNYSGVVPHATHVRCTIGETGCQ